MRDPAGRSAMSDLDLEAALRDLAGSLTTPEPTIVAGAGVSVVALDPARRARLRIESSGSDRARRGWLRPQWPTTVAGRPLGRGVVLALIATIVVAAIAGAIGLGVPGIRITPVSSASPSAPASASSTHTPSPSPSSPSASSPSPSIAGRVGSDLGLGDPIAIADAPTAVDFPIVRPTASGVGVPASAWLLEGRLSFVWPTSSVLPPTREPAVGLILSEFRGSVDPGYFEKIVGPDTIVTTVKVGDVTGYWISGAPHEIVFVDKDGMPVFDSRRIVGDTLLWTNGEITYRLESGLDQAAAIALAGSLR